ncbi:universal stress protein [Halomarina ordinaria]|uniref:Universal stress protein n=1 Tax=Halomarina ordinaria TaxID=3033939 RepID=A0ABD5U6G2_9EURY|nr:universal stress protein [Halomarina sp. PSRA2]
MVRFVVGTNGVETSDRLVEYLSGRVTPDDEVYVVNSQKGGDATRGDDVRGGTEALERFETGLECSVATHQFVRGNSPAEDLLSAAHEYEADELVIGIRKRNPTGKIIFGSTAQDLLLSTERPVVAVPLTDGR